MRAHETSRASRRAFLLRFAVALVSFAAPAASASADDPGAPASPSSAGPTDQAGPSANGAIVPSPPVPSSTAPVTSPRTEVAGFPGVVGNNQFGVVFGVTGAVTRFEPGYAPFRWRVQLVASAAVRGSDTGVTSPLQSADLRLDFPGLLDGRLRVYALLRYRRSLRAAYYGVGNGTDATIPADYAGPPDRYFMSERQMLEARTFARHRIRRGLDLIVGLGIAGLDTTPYDDSLLDRDATASQTQADPVLRAYTRKLLVDGLVGVLFDDRDDEFNPMRGGCHEVSFRGGGGPSADRRAAYGSLYFNSRWFFPLAGEKLVLALRAIADVGFGPMPLVGLTTIGGYSSLAGPAGPGANRGLPYGRQMGRVKLLGNVELRSTFARFHVRRQRFGLGAVVFVDASRVFASVLEVDGAVGGGPPLRFGVGGGLRVLWGRAFVFRMDLGVSPTGAVDQKTSVQATFAIGHAF